MRKWRFAIGTTVDIEAETEDEALEKVKVMEIKSLEIVHLGAVPECNRCSCGNCETKTEDVEEVN